MKYLGKRNVGLDAVLAEQQNYEKSGFKTHYRNVRFAGMGGGGPSTPDVADLTIFSSKKSLHMTEACLPPHARVSWIIGWSRRWGRLGNSATKAGISPATAWCAPVVIGCSIGPLFADTPAAADQLFQALRRHVPESVSLFIDAPDANKEALALAQRHGFTKCSRPLACIRECPPIPAP